jgi:uncharacterized protein
MLPALLVDSQSGFAGASPAGARNERYTDSVHALLRSTAHRPWPLRPGPWLMQQTWHDLLFAHWPVPPDGLRPIVPSRLSLDSFDGQCWVGVVPFWMSGVRARGLPPLPGLSRFPELNVRTYVTHAGKPGVYFFSLDAANLPAVWAARTFFHLPYHHASMTSVESEGAIQYSSQRHLGSANFRGRYRPATPPLVRDRGTLADFLTSRYCLYTTHRNRVYGCDIHHLPWPLQDAEAEFEDNTVAAAAHIALPDTAPVLHFAKRLDVLIWPLRHADGSSTRV